MGLRQNSVSGRRSGQVGKPVKIPKDVLDKLEAMPDKKHRPWKEWEYEVLRQYADQKPLHEIAKILGRSLSSIYNQKYKI